MSLIIDPMNFRVFDDHLAEVLDCGDEVGEWLDIFLGKTGLRMVYHFLKKTQREMTGLQKKFPHFLPTDKVLIIFLYFYYISNISHSKCLNYNMVLVCLNRVHFQIKQVTC